MQLTRRRSRTATAPFHLQIDNQIEALSNVIRPHLCRDWLSIEIKSDTHVDSISRIAQTSFNLVPVLRVRIRDGIGGDDGSRVERVEKDASVPLPLRDVDLRGPARGAGEPKGGPGALCRRGLELGGEVQPAGFGDVELLVRVHGAAVVLEVQRTDVDGRQGERTARGDRVGLGHACRPIVSVAPGVVVAEVGLQIGLGVEAGRRD